ncbi:zinc-binding dehydrogenase [Pradoshia sp. D12]|uniref:zinc-dependent alcohol dehydrogenase n=1 Tax=Bacillaceae TaxID=186817 RepID=UPI00080AFBF9|nr:MULTISPECIES: zinc-binding dehydrogenase [Bacillaceae]OCA80755.1 zinc-dependent dehydrogenase [Bacillus sp. FJAT-27986]QFK70035.1 zinc-binding dehydrogenase [Pradoshia sp. D12]TPF70595.1 zinc-binding dehydrogenase [Bacillus sp. D12]
MKAGVYHGLNDVRVEELPMPTIGPKDVLLRTLRCGICGTDINIVKAGAGNMGIRYEKEFGHEFFGEVAEVGSEVKDIQVGMRVGVNPITAKRVGKALSCEAGGFSQFVVIEDAALNHNLYTFSDEVTPEEAALMEPMSVGFHGAFSTNPKPGEHIVVLGAGPIGLSAAAGLIGEGIKDVVVVDINDWRLAKAQELGAKTINTTKQDLATTLVEYFGTAEYYGFPLPNVDAFIDAAGAPPLFEQAFKMAKPDARFAIVAVYKQDVPVSFSDIMSKEVKIIGASGYTHEDIVRVVDHIEKKKTPIATMVTQVYKLDDLSKAFDTAIAANETIKVVVDLTD